MTLTFVKRIDFGKHMTPRDLPMLVGVPFEQWPEGAKHPWWWNGWTTREDVCGGRYRRARARVKSCGKVVSPARLLFTYLTGTEPPAGSQFHHKASRLWRGITKDDVNPFNYTNSTIGFVQPETSRPRANEGLRWLLVESDFYPETPEQVIERFPDAAGIPRDEIELTLRSLMK